MTTQTSNPLGNLVAGVLGIASIVGLLALIPWLAMLLIGALHAEVFSTLPPYGFWQSVLIVISLGFFGAIWNATTTRK